MSHIMWPAMAAIVLFYGCLPCIHGDKGCGDVLEYDCRFQESDGRGRRNQLTTCGWTPSKGLVFVHDREKFDASMGLAYDADETSLTSPMACSKEGHTFCLTFLFYLDLSDVIDLTVSVISDRKTDEPDVHNPDLIEPGSDEWVAAPLWQLSATSWPPSWEHANVPIQEDSNFRVVFSAKRRPDVSVTRNHNVYFDNVQFVNSSCMISPPTAMPRFLTTTTSTTPEAITSAETLTTTVSAGPEDSSDASNASSPDSPSSSNVGVIAGGVAAAVALLVVIMAAVLILLRRRRRREKPKTGSKMGGGDENICTETVGMSARNAACTTPINAANEEATVGLDQAEHDKRRAERHVNQPPTSTPASADHYSVIGDAGEASVAAPHSHRCVAGNRRDGSLYPTGNRELDPEYAVVNKQHSRHNATAGNKQYDPSTAVNKQQTNTTSGVYHVLEKTTSQQNDRPNVYSFPDEEHQGKPFPVQDNGEYNTLDFDGKLPAGPPRAREGKGQKNTSLDLGGKIDSDRESGDNEAPVYSHLRDGGEDAYSEMRRGNRSEAIDGAEYSHIR